MGAGEPIRAEGVWGRGNQSEQRPTIMLGPDWTYTFCLRGKMKSLELPQTFSHLPVVQWGEGEWVVHQARGKPLYCERTTNGKGVILLCDVDTAYQPGCRFCWHRIMCIKVRSK